MGGKVLEFEHNKIYDEALAIGEARILVKHVESLIHTLAKPIEEVCALVGTTSEAYMSAKELIDK